MCGPRAGPSSDSASRWWRGSSVLTLLFVAVVLALGQVMPGWLAALIAAVGVLVGGVLARLRGMDVSSAGAAGPHPEIAEGGLEVAEGSGGVSVTPRAGAPGPA